MQVTTNTNLKDFQTWSGATDTKDTILEHNKADEFDSLIEDLYPNGVSDTQLNDLLWFEENFIFESLGIDEEE